MRNLFAKLLVLAVAMLCGCGDDSSSVVVRIIPAESENDLEESSSSVAKVSSSSAKLSSSSIKSSSSSEEDETEPESSSSNEEASSSSISSSEDSLMSSSSQESESSSSEEVVYYSSAMYISDFETVKIGNQEWMTENLNAPVTGSKCYDDELENCEKYGRIYTWAQAMGIDGRYDHVQLGEITLPYRGICPEGSHLPSHEEWNELYDNVQENPENKAYFVNQLGGAYDWSGFYRSEDEESVFWTSTEYDVSGTKYVFEYAWIWAYRKDESVAWSNPHKYMGSYVRCIVDEKDLIENN